MFLLPIPTDAFGCVLKYYGPHDLIELENAIAGATVLEDNHPYKKLFDDRYQEVAASDSCRRSELTARAPRACVERFVRASAFSRQVRSNLLMNIDEEERGEVKTSFHDCSQKTFPPDDYMFESDYFLLVTTSGGSVAFEGFMTRQDEEESDYKLVGTLEDSPDADHLHRSIGSYHDPSYEKVVSFSKRGQGVVVVLAINCSDSPDTTFDVVRAASGLRASHGVSFTAAFELYDQGFGSREIRMYRSQDGRDTIVRCKQYRWEQSENHLVLM